MRDESSSAIAVGGRSVPASQSRITASYQMLIIKPRGGNLTQKYILGPEMFSVIVLQACRWNAGLIQIDKCHD